MMELIIPRLSADAEEVSISRWFVSEQDKINKGQPLLEVMFDKATQQVDSPVDGLVRRIIAAEGEAVLVGQTVAELEGYTDEGRQSEFTANSKGVMDNAAENGEAEDKVEHKDVKEPENRIKSSPAARMLAKENHIDLKDVTGNGPEGRIVLKDVKKELEEKAQKVEMVRTIKAQGLELKGLRKVIAERMTWSYQNAPHVTIVMSADVSDIQKFLGMLKEEQRRISLTSIITKAAAMALREYPVFRSLINDSTVTIAENINIGVAVDIGRGLMVPVISDVDKKGLYDIDKELKGLIKSVEEGTLTNEQSVNGSFTISNLGMYDVEIFTPIINPPQSAILGVGKVMDELSIDNGSIVAKPRATLSLSFDHRIADGALAAKFLKTIKNLLEYPLLLIV